MLSSLNAVISTIESTEFITGHVIYNPAFIYTFQLKTTIAVQIKEPPLKSLNDLHTKSSNFKLLAFGGGATHATILRWANISARNYQSYQYFIEPHLIKFAFTLEHFEETRQPEVAFAMEDFTIISYFKECKIKKGYSV